MLSKKMMVKSGHYLKTLWVSFSNAEIRASYAFLFAWIAFKRSNLKMTLLKGKEGFFHTVGSLRNPDSFITSGYSTVIFLSTPPSSLLLSKFHQPLFYKQNVISPVEEGNIRTTSMMGYFLSKKGVDGRSKN